MMVEYKGLISSPTLVSQTRPLPQQHAERVVWLVRLLLPHSLPPLSMWPLTIVWPIEGIFRTENFANLKTVIPAYWARTNIYASQQKKVATPHYVIINAQKFFTDGKMSENCPRRRYPLYFLAVDFAEHSLVSIIIYNNVIQSYSLSPPIHELYFPLYRGLVGTTSVMCIHGNVSAVHVCLAIDRVNCAYDIAIIQCSS